MLGSWQRRAQRFKAFASGASEPRLFRAGEHHQWSRVQGLGVQGLGGGSRVQNEIHMLILGWI